MANLPITELSPDTSPPSDRSIRAVVTLSWPYSSSTRQVALLLADPDFRLRNRKGQVRVRFTGPSAEAVAHARIGIGDEILLALAGASWEQDPEATRTPGNSVDGELLFRRRLQLDIVKADGNVRIYVDTPQSPPRSVEKEVEIATPLPRAVPNLKPSLDGTSDFLPGYVYTSPAFRKRLRLSGQPVVDSAYDPFAGDADQSEQSHKQNWLSFGSNVKWRYAEKTPSPVKEAFDQDVVHVGEERSVPEAVQTPSQSERPQTCMSPPPLPPIRIASKQSPIDLDSEGVASDERSEGHSTPQLRLVESATLPLPPPFTADSHHARLERRPSLSSHLDEILPESEIKDRNSSSQGLRIAELQAQTSEETANTSQNGSIRDTEMADAVSQRPQTPVARGAEERPFGLDGNSSISPSNRVTPQSEKAKVMAETYRSLFGFRTSPDASSEASQEPPASPTPLHVLPDARQNALDAAERISAGNGEEVPASSAAHSSKLETQSASQTDSRPYLNVIQQTATMPASDIEVIELGSSSDEEEEEQTQPAQSLSLPLPERVVPQSENTEPFVGMRDEKLLFQTISEVQETISPVEPQPSPTGHGIFDSLEELLPDRISPSEAIELRSSSPVATAAGVGGHLPSMVVRGRFPDQILSNGEVNVDSDERAESSNNQEQITSLQHSVTEASLYPSLPLSPSNSQSIADMKSQATADRPLPEIQASTLPPTPQLTQDVAFSQLQAPAQHQASMAVEDSEEPFTREKDNAEELQSPSMKKTPVRKSLSARTSIVPDGISDWFSPKRSPVVMAKDAAHEEVHDEHDALVLQETKKAISPPHTQGMQHGNGLSTPLSYFTPLSRLEELVNPSSQQSHGANIIDVFAIVADETSGAVQAKTGPRDYFTIFKVSDSSITARSRTRVEVYRPWHATLPVASVGDVILLRAFAVKSRNRKPYLLSTDASAWCVWKYSETGSSVKGGDKPIWARKRGGPSDSFTEEAKGPPLELGDEERVHAIRLHEWWKTSEDESDEHREDNVAGITGRSAQAVAAKFYRLGTC